MHVFFYKFCIIYYYYYLIIFVSNTITTIKFKYLGECYCLLLIICGFLVFFFVVGNFLPLFPFWSQKKCLRPQSHIGLLHYWLVICENWWLISGWLSDFRRIGVLLIALLGWRKIYSDLSNESIYGGDFSG